MTENSVKTEFQTWILLALLFYMSYHKGSSTFSYFFPTVQREYEYVYVTERCYMKLL